MMSEDLSLFLVFVAGLLSFLSPCVLPLIPSYLSILGGVGLNGGENQVQSRHGLLRTAFAFVLGFSVVFIALGILVSTTFFLMGGMSLYINWAAGIIVIILGLNVIFDFLSLLNYEKRPWFAQKMPQAMKGMPAAFIAGAAFGTGWTPCIGPILTGILLLAAQSGRTGIAVFYLALYSSGLALPFLMAAVFFDFFTRQTSRLRPHLHLIRRISGILLVVIGLMILTGRYSAFNRLSQSLVFSYIGWAEGRALPFRLLAGALQWLQSF